MLDETRLIEAAKSAHELAVMINHEEIKLTELSESTVVYNPDAAETEWLQYWETGKPDGHPL